LQTRYGQRIQRKSMLDKYLADFKVPMRLAMCAKKSLRIYEAQRQYNTDYEAFLRVLPQNLKSELDYYICVPLLFSHPFFGSCRAGLYKWVLRVVCEKAISQKHIHPGEVVFHRDRLADAMFLVLRGSFKYIRPRSGTRSFNMLQNQGSCLTSNSSSFGPKYLSEGEWASEHCLWVMWAHLGTLSCETEAQALILEHAQFEEAVSMQEDTLKLASVYGRLFAESLRAVPEEDRSDLWVYEPVEAVDCARRPSVASSFSIRSSVHGSQGISASLSRGISWFSMPSAT